MVGRIHSGRDLETEKASFHFSVPRRTEKNQNVFLLLAILNKLGRSIEKA